MEIAFKNTYTNNYISEIILSVNNLVKEEWYPYSLKVISLDDELLLGIEETFSSECLRVFIDKLGQVLDHPEKRVVFEPIEPSFTLTFNILNDTLIKLLLVIDMEFVRNGTATQTGMGVLIHVDRNDFRVNLEKMKSEID